MQSATVNKENYLIILGCLGEAVRKKRPDLCKDDLWKLPHDMYQPTHHWPKMTPLSYRNRHVQRIWPRKSFSSSHKTKNNRQKTTFY